MPDRAVRLRVRRPEDLQRLVLGRRREREVAGVGQQLARLHHAVDPVLVGLLLALLARLRQRLRHGRAGAPALAGVRLVDDDREAAPTLLVADLVQDERELLDRGDDDLLAALDEPAQVARAVGVPDGRPHLRVLPDRVPDLTVEDHPVGDHDDRVEDRRVVPGQPDQLVGQPGDGVALAAAGRVLDQVAPARAVGAGVGQQPAHHVELVVARPDLLPALPAALLVLRLHHLGVVLQDVGEAPPGQHLPPQVVDRQPVRVRRIARTVVPAPVERQEPRRLAGEPGAELHLPLVHGEVRDAAPELEQLLPRVAILLILQDRVVHRLLGQAVLQLEGEHRQPVDEQPDVQRPLRLVPAVAKLPGDREAVLIEPFPRPRVVSRGRAVEEVQVQRSVLDSRCAAPRSCRAWRPRPAAGSGTPAGWDRLWTAPAPRRPRAECHAGMPRAAPGRPRTHGHSHGSCRRSTPLHRIRPQDRPRCRRPADRTDTPPAPCRSAVRVHARRCHWRPCSSLPISLSASRTETIWLHQSVLIPPL